VILAGCGFRRGDVRVGVSILRGPAGTGCDNGERCRDGEPSADDHTSLKRRYEHDQNLALVHLAT
jgi:hypothetical protein